MPRLRSPLGSVAQVSDELAAKLLTSGWGPADTPPASGRRRNTKAEDADVSGDADPS